MRQVPASSPQVCGEGHAWRHTLTPSASVSREPAQVCSKHVSGRMDGRQGGYWLDPVFLENYHLIYSENVVKRRVKRKNEALIWLHDSSVPENPEGKKGDMQRHMIYPETTNLLGTDPQRYHNRGLRGLSVSFAYKMFWVDSRLKHRGLCSPSPYWQQLTLNPKHFLCENLKQYLLFWWSILGV